MAKIRDWEKDYDKYRKRELRQVGKSGPGYEQDNKIAREKNDG